MKNPENKYTITNIDALPMGTVGTYIHTYIHSRYPQKDAYQSRTMCDRVLFKLLRMLDLLRLWLGSSHISFLLSICGGSFST